jgi:uncharacterized protein (DUF427 family)
VRVRESVDPQTFDPSSAKVRNDLLQRAGGGRWREWKGRAGYFDRPAAGEVSGEAVRSHQRPSRAFARIAGCVGFSRRIARCIGGGSVGSRAGGFYPGWVTDEIVGPDKIDAGKGDW